MSHRWIWNNPEGRKGQPCRIIVCRKRKALIEFEDGFRMVAPAQGLRRSQHDPYDSPGSQRDRRNLSKLNDKTRNRCQYRHPLSADPIGRELAGHQCTLPAGHVPDWEHRWLLVEEER